MSHLSLSPAQHAALTKALAIAHALHSQGGAGLGVPPGFLDDVDIYVQPGQGGRGWWSSLGDALKTGVTKLQSSDVVRAVEKKGAAYAVKAARGALEGAADGLGDTVATAIGVPEASVLIDKAVDSGASALQRKALGAIDGAIDASGRGHQCGCGYSNHRLSGHPGMMRGSGMRLMGAPPLAGSGMRLSQ